MVPARNVGEVQVADGGGSRQFGRLAGRQVSELAGQISLDVEIGSLEDQRIGPAANLEEVLGSSAVADVHQPGAPTDRAQDLIGTHRRPVRENDALAGNQIASKRPWGDSKSCRPLGQERTARRFLEGEAETSRASMNDGERAEAKSVILQKRPGLDGSELDVDRGAGAPQDNAEEKVVDALQGPGPGPDFQRFDCFPAHERGQQAGQSENVIEVSVGDQDPVQAPESQPRTKNLSLGSFAAVDQEAVISIGDDVRRQSALDGRGRSRCAKEDELNQAPARVGESPAGAPEATLYSG